MEKKTIGKFISALRKSAGLTQKELGDRLFVSDKTISRWECDECTPELSLIPSIAEIFGVTADELLRGERNNPDHGDIVENKQTARSSKQFKLMLDRSNRKYKNLTLISVGITIFGLIAATIANLGYSKGLIAFCLATIFCVASEICQICFAINARIAQDDDDCYADKIRLANNSVTKTAILVSYINILTLSYCLPLITIIDGSNYGLTFGSWLFNGLLFTVIDFIVFYILDVFVIRKILCNRGLLCFDEKHKEELVQNKKTLKKIAFHSSFYRACFRRRYPHLEYYWIRYIP